MDEINKIENDFNKEFPQENFKEIMSNLESNTTSLNNQLVEINILNKKIKETKFVVKAIDFETEVFAEMKEVICV